ncbi:MAG: bifunctional (p)ppGpp synthetase/guanosine-3',5'-bis(diphosphate) 3'-pyrophosphohydrolase [Candidatus Melainabacteria bacterium]
MKNPSEPAQPSGASCPGEPENIPAEREFQLIEELVGILTQQKRSAEDIALVRRAFEDARRLHAGQLRKNKENYVVHPVSVAIILANIPVDTPTVAAALLHDVLEDTPYTADEMRKAYGEDILHIVEGVTKLGKFEFSASEDRQAENFRKMFLAMADDVRIIMLKLADRLHNMQTLCHMKPEKQLKTARETLEIFAPLANRMGMGRLKVELEDLALQYLDPEHYRSIDEEMVHSREERQRVVHTVVDRIQDVLKQAGIEAAVKGRAKHYYSVYKKMVSRQKAFQEIYDLNGVRILVKDEKTCYQVLGIVHSTFTPVPGRFKDYIAMPKSNFYQSLHTTVIGPTGRPLEFQIRTEEMHRIAEYGIAAHWKYKESPDGESALFTEDDQKLTWLRQMVEMKDDAGDAREYVDSIKLDLFRDEVFVFTPKGKVVVLPRDSTPIDFAYRIHTEVGHTCTGAIVNGKIVPLNYVLRNGDIIEILTNAKSQPRLDWIAFIQTQNAKARIRQWFKHHYKDEHILQGRRMLEESLTRAQCDEVIKNGKLLEVAQELNYSTLEDMFVALGYGEINLPRILNRLKLPVPSDKTNPDKADHPVPDVTARMIPDQSRLAITRGKVPARGKKGDSTGIVGLEGMLYHMAKCCSPLPGEPIVGVVTRSRGVMVHRDDCNNLDNANPNRLMIISWEGTDEQSVQSVKLDVLAIDRVGVLKDILTKVSNHHTNISNTKVKLFPDRTALVELTVDVQNLRHLDTLKKAILEVGDVISVKRQHKVQASRKPE